MPETPRTDEVWRDLGATEPATLRSDLMLIAEMLERIARVLEEGPPVVVPDKED